MKIAILSALGNEVLKRCLCSLLETYSKGDHDIFIVRERESREETLNAALEITGRHEDILFVGDDIIFTPGWHEIMMEYYDVADIIGFSTLYPETNNVQDNGYDLIRVDDRITLEAKNRGRSKSEIEPFGYRMCDGLCGCFMLVKKNVFNLVPSFSKDGQNRWGEFIFTHLAKRKKARVAVLQHYVYHGGISTKSNPDKRLSSISYKLEREIWESILGKYVDSNTVSMKYRQELSDTLSNSLNKSEDILLYGAGTVSEFLLKQLEGKAVTICSGLPEEQGIEFNGYTVLDYSDAIRMPYDLIVMTPLYVGESLYGKYIKHNYKENSNASVVAITISTEGDKYVYDEKRIK